MSTRYWLRRKLHAEGMRCTHPRRCITEALEKKPCTHAELVEITGLDRVTVYRNLLALQEIGLVYKVYLPGHDTMYVLCRGEGDTHAHFFCKKCHKGICLPAGSIQIAEPWKSRVERILLVGNCPEQCKSLPHHEDAARN